VKGDRLPSLAKLAATAAFSQVTVTRYGKTETIVAAALTCLWYSVTGTRPVTVILIRDKSKTGHDLALITTEKNPDIAAVIERYAARWAIEVAIEDAKQLFGTGQARNRTARAVERTVPFMLACQALAVCWYATAGHHPADAEVRRMDAPWYTSKTEPSTADMAAKVRRVISPPNLGEFTLTSPNPKKSTPSAWPGKAPKSSPPKPRKSSDHQFVFNLICGDATLRNRMGRTPDVHGVHRAFLHRAARGVRSLRSQRPEAAARAPGRQGVGRARLSLVQD